MKVTVITAFPEFFNDFLKTSIIGRAVKNKLIQVDCLNLREFGLGNYRQIDDYSFGSGGMVMMAEPLRLALEFSCGENHSETAYVVCPSPQGKLLSHDMVKGLVEKAKNKHVVIVCGHYEGIDERFIERYVNCEFSIADAVLSGGEIPAMALIDAMARLVPDVVGRMAAVENDSFFVGMLDHQHYTRPAEWQGMYVPEVLVSGNQSEIKDWRRKQAIQRTVNKRPDLIKCADLRPYIELFSVFIVSEHHDSEKMREVSDLCKMNGVIKNFLVSDNLRFDNFRRVKDLDQVTKLLAKKYSGKYPFMLDFTDNQETIIDWADLKVNLLEANLPILLIYMVESGFWESNILALTFKKLSGAV
ncbi:MAG: tRNA (guanosine(37)-N1)-methyltransferase TrmD [Synergistaceae bacterium]|nr:tRNA (guanosine(37)-N1)-methyltransferase TrmD [Synergistaceae bacterium]